ncbi:MAG TPA: type II/IV secretion system ATPase subunit [Candidatus Krumholzibacteriaceae bacterium]|nr:type II/IV secretion system ATPase subunit [Candidatus Krumholzibacteriaceae bacterium]
MEILNRFIRNNKKAGSDAEEKVVISKCKPDYEVIYEYWVNEPYAKIKIVASEELGEGNHYFVNEVELTEIQYDTYERIVRILSKEFKSPEGEHIDPRDYVFEQAEIIAEKYHRSLGKFNIEEWDQIFYYVVRDLIGYGPLQAISEDPEIEDISCNGVDMPIYVWHRRFESIPTNIMFTSHQALNDFIVKLAHKSAKHISSAQPVLDAMLPEKHRLAATFMKEVSLKGSTFCIRKFRAEPYSIVDLIKIGTLNERIAAYFWFILEHKKSFMIVGGTGAGKTSMLNALLSLMSQNDKIVTVEEVPELSPPVSNWTQLHSRESFNFGDGPSGSINLFDLIKVSLRYRPDYVIVGEIRGEEAYVLFQALATGHGGLCTMHADSIDRVVKRLTSPPMNVSEVYIPLMNIALYIQRVELPNKKDDLNFGRRVRTVSEIAEFDNYIEVSRWDPRKDVFNTWFKDSFILQQISTQSGIPMKEIIEEIDRRERFIEEIVESGVRNQSEVAEKILSYYNRQRNQRTNGEKKRKKEEVPVPQEEETADIIDMLKDTSSSMLEDIVAQPSSEHETESHEVEDEPEVPEPEVPEPGLTEPEVPEPGLTEPELDDEPSPLNDLVKEQETELDFATKVLWELAQDASQLVIDKKMTEDAPGVDAEEVQQA